MGDRQMNMHDGLEAIGAAICNAYNLTTGAMKAESEFLEYSEDDYASPRDCNFIVNVSTNASNDQPPLDRIEHAFEVAHAICHAFNSVMDKDEDDDGSWYVHSEPNFWADNGDEVESIEDAEVVRCHIFQYYK